MSLTMEASCAAPGADRAARSSTRERPVRSCMTISAGAVRVYFTSSCEPARPGRIGSERRERGGRILKRPPLDSSSRIVVFTGAGVSAESGLATFRGVGGLWADFDPATLATPEAFARDPKRVWDWYVSRYVGVRDSEPNAAHRAIARLATTFPSLLVVTQNIDRMHQRAGSRKVLELHGNIWNARCNACGREADMATLIDIADSGAPGDHPPRCGCGGRMRPAVVWFGERLPEAVFEEAAEAAADCDLFITVGTSAHRLPGGRPDRARGEERRLCRRGEPRGDRALASRRSHLSRACRGGTAAPGRPSRARRGAVNEGHARFRPSFASW